MNSIIIWTWLKKTKTPVHTVLKNCLNFPCMTIAYYYMLSQIQVTISNCFCVHSFKRPYSHRFLICSFSDINVDTCGNDSQKNCQWKMIHNFLSMIEWTVFEITYEVDNLWCQTLFISIMKLRETIGFFFIFHIGTYF